MHELTNLVKVPPCYKNLKDTSLDVLLTNKPNSFQKTIICETGLSECHMVIATTLRSTFINLPQETGAIKISMKLFLKLIQGGLYRSGDPYLKLKEIFSSILDKHAPIKSKQIRENQAPFMNKSLSKIIMQKSNVRNKYLKSPSRKNFSNYKKV